MAGSSAHTFYFSNAITSGYNAPLSVFFARDVNNLAIKNITFMNTSDAIYPCLMFLRITSLTLEDIVLSNHTANSQTSQSAISFLSPSQYTTLKGISIRNCNLKKQSFLKLGSASVKFEMNTLSVENTTLTH